MQGSTLPSASNKAQGSFACLSYCASCLCGACASLGSQPRGHLYNTVSQHEPTAMLHFDFFNMCSLKAAADSWVGCQNGALYCRSHTCKPPFRRKVFLLLASETWLLAAGCWLLLRMCCKTQLFLGHCMAINNMNDAPASVRCTALWPVS